jgi:hypothetical protein
LAPELGLPPQPLPDAEEGFFVTILVDVIFDE